MAKRVGVDKWLFCVTLLLVVIGLLMIFSGSAVMAKQRYGSPYIFVIRQSIWAVLGLATMLGLMQIDYRRYNRPAIVYSLVGLTILLLLSVFLIRDSHHTHRWIHFGEFSLQPSELAKPVLVLFLAWFLQDKLHAVDDWRNTLLPAVAPSVFFVLLVLCEPDLGTGLVLAAVTALMLYLAGTKWKYFFYASLAAAPVLYLMLFRVPWRRARMLAFINPEADPRGAGFHIIQSLIAVGTGGIHGLGYMEGRQKLFYLPQPHTDFIFANIAEELGLIGSLAIVALFIVLGYRGFRASRLSKDMFARFLAFGITVTILIQAFFNISVVLALVPTKGITLPFISSGGTSLFFMLASVGVLLSVTREVD